MEEAMSANVVQMNIRLDKQVKTRADKVIEQAGYTTTQFFRLVWDILARPESNVDTVQRMLAVTDSQNNSDKQQKSNKVLEGSSFIQQALKEHGIKVSSLPNEKEQALLMDDIMSERYGECDL
jgi:antitoxin component of RelBE/YafQ-DinJ toxin-antitoxin module